GTSSPRSSRTSAARASPRARCRRCSPTTSTTWPMPGCAMTSTCCGAASSISSGSRSTTSSRRGHDMARLPSYDRLTREQLESPGAATERQARLERAVERVMRGVVARLLERFAAIAAREGLAMGAAVTYAEWARAVDEGLGELDDEQGAWLRTALEESDIPDVAYDSALVVLSAGAVEGWSRATTADQIRLALRLDAGPSDPVA